jgi:hypothetical protein
MVMIQTPHLLPIVQRATTPDGIDLGPTDKKKTFCLKKDSFKITTSVHANEKSIAQARQDIVFEALKTGKQDKKDCSCDCGVYRHWIRGYMKLGSSTAAKQYELDSCGIDGCGKTLTIDEKKYTEEYTCCLGDKNSESCKWLYIDGPAARGLKDGIYIEMHFEYKYEVYDNCQGKRVSGQTKTLDIVGDKSPRTVKWT